MVANRSTKLSLKFATERKRQELARVLAEYARVVNGFITQFWDSCPRKMGLLKPVVDSVPSWFSFRLRKVAAREAVDMITASRKRWGKKAVMPAHRGTRMCCSSAIASLNLAEDGAEFDAWLHLQSIGEGVILSLPVRLHKHFHRLAARGRRVESYVITRDSVQLCFEIDAGTPRTEGTAVGVDTGIKALASLSTGEQLGTDIEARINRVKRCKHGSKGQLRARRALRQRVDEVARDVATKADIIVVEDLTGIAIKTKRRLGKEVRRSIGAWNVRYWMSRLQQRCEDGCAGFFRVLAAYTSQMCSKCGYTDRRNRRGQVFRCLKCSHEANADVQASPNILARFLTGPYGAGCKAA